MRAVDIEAFAITGHEDGACFSREREEVVVMWIAAHGWGVDRVREVEARSRVVAKPSATSGGPSRRGLG